ncbi:MAG: hemerythrin domain-containing protein [Streptosporangiaceae bacterium]|jgi:hypothetical protein
MAAIIELIAADHLHIMRWQMRLAELRHRSEPSQSPALAATWDTLTALIDLHMAADEEVCGPALYGTGPDGLELARQARDAHADIREIIREASQFPAGSPRWWALATVALAAWTQCLHREVYGPLADCRGRASRGLRARLGRQWRAFMDAQIRDRYQAPAPEVPTCQLRRAYPAAGVPRLADPAFAPLACICPACTRELDPVPDAAADTLGTRASTGPVRYKRSLMNERAGRLSPGLCRHELRSSSARTTRRSSRNGSVLPTQGSANPALTIMAVAARAADHLAS